MQVRQGLLDRVPGTELRLLAYEFDGRICECRWNRFPTVTVDDDCAIRRQRGGSLKRVTQHRLAAYRVQDLGQSGVHARSLARGKDDDVERGSFHGEKRG
jgi:hypothetical protein